MFSFTGATELQGPVCSAGGSAEEGSPIAIIFSEKREKKVKE